MAEISKIKLPTGTTYDIKDATAREMIAAVNQFTYTVSQSAATTPQGIIWYNGSGTKITGTLVASADTMYKIYLVLDTGTSPDAYTEYITVPDPDFPDSSYYWERLGDTHIALSDLGDLAYKDSASGSFTPSGTINVTLTTASKYVATSAGAGGSSTAGTAAQCTLPVFSTSVSDETLTLGWTAGSFTANTPTQVTMPTFSQQTIATGVSTKTFTGTAGTVTVS